jgi:hypothetical protein
MHGKLSEIEVVRKKIVLKTKIFNFTNEKNTLCLWDSRNYKNLQNMKQVAQ